MSTNASNEYLDKLESRPRQQREEWYARKLQEQIAHAYSNSPAMRAKFDGAGIRPDAIRQPRDLEAVPITRKDRLMDLRRADPPFGGLLGVPREKLRKVFMSPGPIYDFGSVDQSFYRRFQRGFFAAGFRPGDLVVNCMSYHMVPAGHWIDQSLTTFGCAVIPMGTGNTELQAQVLRDMRVTGWIGIASFLMTVLNKCEAMGYDVKRDLSLRVAMPHAEPGGAAMREVYEQKYGIASSDIYPTADVGVIAYECRHKQGMHIAEEMLVEIVDSNGKQLGPGEPGEVVVTPLENSTYPLIRFGTGDLSSLVDEPCACGRSSLKLSRILGRIGDAVKARGMFVHPREIAEVAAKVPGAGKYQVIISRRGFNDEVCFKMERTEQPGDQEAAEAAIRGCFQDICRLRLDRVVFVPADTIPKDAKVIVDERTY